ncbi:hypothetical protein BK022_25525 [Methylorubrum extorquens]|uniref:Uncharacterized protein n=1 Tax=Methylorubrum extorquens TaxID=408 RepID=A0A1S1NV49_METEX|nr:hypothetical protein BK022_25525 [Methylorubrum extorquens]
MFEIYLGRSVTPSAKLRQLLRVDVEYMDDGISRKIRGVAGPLTIVKPTSEHKDSISILQHKIRTPIAINSDLTEVPRMAMGERRQTCPT